MIRYALYSLVLLFYSFNTYSQSIAEKNNRQVYNRIEFFFNTQQTDSIYAMASPLFQQNIPLQKLEMALQYFYNFGQIKDASPASYSNGIAGYNITVGNKKGSIFLKTDSTFHFDFLEIKDQEIATEKKENVKSVVQKNNALDEYIDSLALTYIQQKNAQALAIGLIHKGKTNTFYYGETIKGDTLSLPKENTLFELGSITKVFTATLLADLVERKVITLDDSISKYLPDSLAQNQYLQKITFKDLANHTSGLPRIPSNLDKVPKFVATAPYAQYGRKELFSYLKNIELKDVPGNNFEYSNTGFALLGELISSISKKTYSQCITEVITSPLGLLNTVEKINYKTQSIPKVYSLTGTEVPLWQWQAFAGAGGLKSTITDMMKFVQAQFKMPENRLEHAMALTKQFTYYLPPSTDIGLAWHMNMLEDVVQYWHNGATGGSSAFLALVPDSKSAIIVLSNSAISVDEISTQIISKVIADK
ncbi:serine hydrolase domain-containing protein [Sphingobacterium yanglingense]|uniref:CubicO group peptidase (Beta-lactamase class C family) n=1 Tax=Sphingobacterium yanglingense TaxID=1437280 RepID=A0A4R6WI52_9SPHI|nr:serine hydrolase domain-containing protein [Sphingobacterium yanglingense]TDQ77236.1 CubicO group peptidase (beta-lactamase class C family) [Sphingobacterium yanglingense]